MSGIYFWITVLFIVQLFTQNTFAQDLSATGFFNRCYTQLTGKPVPLNHALMSKVKSGDISAIDACIQILHKGQLTTSGPLTTPGDPESRAVLNNFYTFHRTWFATNNVNSIQGYSAGEQNGTGDVFDASEPALSVTYSLFFPGQKYSDTLTRATGVHAIRSEDNTIAARMKWKSAFPGRYLIDDPMMANSVFSFRATATTPTEVNRNINKHISSKLNVPNIEVGNLIGIRATIESLVVPNLSLSPLGNTNTDKGSLYADKLNYSYDLYKNLGGGILGSPIYILENLGHGFDMKFNGQTKVARRWSQANMNSFLCANLPSLREMDVQKFVDPTSSAPFRNGTSCVMCHATLDQMAYTLRNVTVGATDYFLPNLDGDVTIDASGKQVNPPRANVRTSISITTYKSLNESVTGWPTEPVTDF
ncbi:MAG TPA: hypothetical protein VN132_11300, partial [Bdellovibrio sp.]|nr:hypothetical protein [Bdellovibrio sp.]